MLSDDLVLLSDLVIDCSLRVCIAQQVVSDENWKRTSLEQVCHLQKIEHWSILLKQPEHEENKTNWQT